MIEDVDTAVRAEGLGRSRDIAKVAPAVEKATVEALLDTELVGTEITNEVLVNVHSVSIRALTKAINAASITSIAEGTGGAEEKTSQLEALIEQAGESLDAFGFTSEETTDALQKMAWVMTETGNSDIEDPSQAESLAAVTNRLNLLTSVLAGKIDNAAAFFRHRLLWSFE